LDPHSFNLPIYYEIDLLEEQPKGLQFNIKGGKSHFHCPLFIYLFFFFCNLIICSRKTFEEDCGFQ